MEVVLRGVLLASRRSCLLPTRRISTSRLPDPLRVHVSDVLKRYASLVERANRSQESEDGQRQLFRVMAELKPVATLAEKLAKRERELTELREELSDDVEVRELVREEEARLRRELEEVESQLVKALVPRDEADDHSAILEVRAGAGGDEASLFAEEVLQMYQNFCLHKFWQFELLSSDHNDRGGCKHATASLTGQGVFGFMKLESGVHRVQRIPVTEGKDRVHTSTISVVILPQPTKIGVDLLPGDLKIDTFRASGAGGQHVNKTDSAVRMTHLPTGLTVSMQDERSQHKNRAKALKVLSARIYERQRIAAVKERSQQRRQQIGTAERHEKVRTYNFPQDRVTEHRLGRTVHGVLAFMEGGALLEGVANDLRAQEEARALTQLFQDST